MEPPGQIKKKKEENLPPCQRPAYEDRKTTTEEHGKMLMMAHPTSYFSFEQRNLKALYFRGSAMTKKNLKIQIPKIIQKLKQKLPNAGCSLDYQNPLELLAATILSAQCTDERVNKVTPFLFQKYPKVQNYADAKLQELEKEIRSTGFYRNKAKNIQGACRMMIKNFSGSVPNTMEDLLTLPGVARKTANVVLGNAYGLAEGIAVDTHVKRLSHRLGLSQEQSPEKIEVDLMGIVPRKEWIQFSHLLIHHGRLTCQARKPLCDQCVLNNLCPRIGLTGSPVIKS